MEKCYSEPKAVLATWNSRISKILNQMNLLKLKASDLHLSGNPSAAHKIELALDGIDEQIRVMEAAWAADNLDAKVTSYCHDNMLDVKNYEHYRRAIIAVSKGGN